MKVSKLISDEHLLEVVARTGTLLQLEGRCIGTTTSLAMETIANAMAHPDREYRYCERLPSTISRVQQRDLDENLYRVIRSILEALDLKNFEFRKEERDYFICYKPYREVDITSTTVYTVTERE